MCDEAKPERDLRSGRVEVLGCESADPGTERSEHLTIVTLADTNGRVHEIVLDNKDTRRLAMELLNSLFRTKETFAVRVLQEMFPSDGLGGFYWPKAISES